MPDRPERPPRTRPHREPHQPGAARAPDRPDARADLPRCALRARLRQPVRAAGRHRAERADHRQAGQRRPPDPLRGATPTRGRWPPPSATKLEAIIGPLGFFRAKTESLLKLSAALVERHGGEVPPRLKDLVELPGVGRKTANVVLGNAFGIPGITVDTHFGRLSRRFGWTEETDPVKAEHAVGALFPKKDWMMLSHHLIWHGRRCCHAQKPACGACPVARWCPSYGEGPTDPETAAKLFAPRAAREQGGSRCSPPCCSLAALAGCDDETQFVPGPGAVQGDGRQPRPARAQGRRSAWRTARRVLAAARCLTITLPCLGGGTERRPLVAEGAAGAQLLVRRLRALPRGDAGVAGLRRPVRRPGARDRRRLPGPVPRQRAGGGREARGDLPVAGRSGR